MKSLIIAAVLFTLVISIVLVNFLILNSLLDYSENILEKIPTEPDKISELSEKDKEKVEENLKKLEKKWKSNQSFLCTCMRHEKSRDFIKEIISAKAYFETEEIPDFIVNIRSVKDSLAHMRYDEGLKLGNLL